MFQLQLRKPPVTSARIRSVWIGLAGAGLILVGCGGGSATSTVASLGGHATARQQSAASLSQQSDSDMIAFARCMRSHGVQMSDPFHRSGHQGLSIDMPTPDAANSVGYRACNHILAPIIQAKEQGAAARAAPVLGALARYAACMRGHDIAMLDPTSPGGSLNLGTVPGITDNFGRYSPQFRAADAVCRRVLPPSIHDDGTGP